MSPLPRIHAAPHVTTLPESAGAESGSGSSGNLFADVMRAVFHPTPAPHAAAHLRPTRSHPEAEENASKESPAGSLNSDAGRQAPFGPGNSRVPGAEDASGRTQKNSLTATTMTATTVHRVTGNASGSADAQAAAPAKNSYRATSASQQSDSAITGSLPAGTPQQKTPPASDIANSILIGTAGSTVSAPTGASGTVSIASETNVPGSGVSPSNLPGTENSGNSGPVNNSATSSVLQSGKPSAGESTTGDGTLSRMTGSLQMTDPGYPKAGQGGPEGSAVSTREIGAAFGPAFGPASGPGRSPGKDMKQSSGIDTGNTAGEIRNSASASSEAGKQNSAAAHAAGDPAIPGNGGSSTNGSGNGLGHALGSGAGNSTAAPAANVSTSSDSTAGNGNAASGNGGSTSPSNSKSSTGPVSRNMPASQSGADRHAMPTLPQAEAAHANPANQGPSPDGKSSLVPASGSPGPAGNSGVAHALSSTGSSAGRATPSDAFTALDSGSVAEHGVLLHAGPHQVAVGVADPALGWVEVRAERVGGQITAALTADSAASHAALTSVMPSMATYLQDHQAGVQHIHVETGLAGGQAGAGSQGQASSQGDARGGTESAAVPASGGTGWKSAATIAEQTSHTTTTRSTREGHRVSVRA